MVNNRIMANYLTQQEKIANSQVVQAQSQKRKRNNGYSNASSTVSNSTGSSVSSNTLSTMSNNGSNYESVSGDQPTGTIPVAQPIGPVVGPGSMASYQQSQQYSNAPTIQTVNSEMTALRNINTTGGTRQSAESVSIASHVAAEYERLQRELTQLQQVTSNARLQTTETTRKALSNQYETYKKRLIETAQKLLQIVAIRKRLENGLKNNINKKRPVPFPVGQIFGR